MQRVSGVRRLPLRGTGLLLRAPMVVDVGPAGTPKRGDVVVFRWDGRTFAHRIIGVDGDAYVTASDARPWLHETVRRDALIGRVLAVWSDDSPQARRVDGPLHRVLGHAIVVGHPLLHRALPRVYEALAFVERLDPRRRPRPAQRLVAALAAVMRSDGDALRRALDGDAAAVAAADARHRCLATIGDLARGAGIAEALPAELAAGARAARLAAALANTRMHRAVTATVELLRASGVPFVLLKGAARVYAGDADAARHASDDIDVLVQRTDVERLESFLMARGYGRDPNDDPAEHYRTRHHHAASLYPPNGAFPIEIHHALAPPGSVSLATDWDALAGHVRPVAGAGGEVLVFDDVATALHLGVHAIGLARLRDIALLAGLLRTLSAADAAALQALVARERVDGVRLRAAFALAARVAGVAWPADAPVERYLRWALAREDLPRRLRLRCDAVELARAFPQRPWLAAHGLLPWKPALREVPRYPGRLLGRIVSNAGAAGYAACLPNRASGA